jgi:hypothetical protein
MAIRTISNAGGNWNSTSTWVEGIVPGGLDDVVATATSGNLTVTAAASAKSINFTNYVGTFKVNTGIVLSITPSAGTVPFGITMVAGMIVDPTGAGILSFQTSCTLTSGGNIWPGTLRFNPSASRVYTLGDAWTINGNIEILPLATSNVTFANNSFTVRGNIVVSTANRTLTVISTGGCFLTIAPLNGTTSTISTTNTTPGTAALRMLMILNGQSSAANIVFDAPSGSSLELASMTYTSGTVSMSAVTQLRFGIASTLNLSGIAPLAGIIAFTGSVTYAISSPFTVSGNLGFGTTTSAVNPILNGSTITVNNGSCYAVTTGNMTLTGTTIISFTGNGGSISPFIGATGRWGLSLSINLNAAGTMQIPDIRFGGPSTVFTYTSGTISWSGGGISSTTWVNTTSTTSYVINGSGFSFPLFSHGLGSSSFSGTNGCSFYRLTNASAGTSITLKSGNSYTVTSQLSLAGSSTTAVSILGSVPSSYAILTLPAGATQSVSYVSATDIDSSLGQTIWDFSGTLTRTINWNLIPSQPATLGSIFV